jgi:hypothetical protein
MLTYSEGTILKLEDISSNMTRILSILQEDEPLNSYQIEQKSGIRHATVSWTLKQMEELDLIQLRSQSKFRTSLMSKKFALTPFGFAVLLAKTYLKEDGLFDKSKALPYLYPMSKPWQLLEQTIQKDPSIITWLETPQIGHKSLLKLLNKNYRELFRAILLNEIFQTFFREPFINFERLDFEIYFPEFLLRILFPDTDPRCYFLTTEIPQMIFEGPKSIDDSEHPSRLASKGLKPLQHQLKQWIDEDFEILSALEGWVVDFQKEASQLSKDFKKIRNDLLST